MLENIIVNILVVLAMIGWGQMLAQALKVNPTNKSDVFLFGLLSSIPLGALGLIINFFFPINVYISSLVLFLGAAAFFRSRPIKVTNYKGAIFFAVSFLFVVGLSVDNNILGDSVLYHIQTLLWIKEEKIVFGLANVHDRFGFNSLWHLIVAILTPKMNFAHYVDPVASALTILFAGFVGSRSIETYKVGSRWMFYFFIAITFFVIWGKTANASTLGSPATDLSTRIYTITFLVLWWEWLHDKKNISAFLILSLAAFIPMLKLSKIHVLIPAGFVLWTLLKESQQKKNIFYILGVSGIFGMIWVLRTWLLSGCLIFPAPATCTGASWSLPIAEVIDINLWIKSWAREPITNPSVVLENWNWFTGWLQRSAQIGSLVVNLVIVLLALLFGFKRILKTQPQDKWIYFYLAAAFSFWFFSAPDWRFIIGVLTFATAFLLDKVFSSIELRYVNIFKWVFGFIFILTAQDFLRITVSAFNNSPLRKIQNYSEVPGFISKTSKNGTLYYINETGNFYCGFISRPCAPFERPLLSEDHYGPYKVFKSKN